MHLKLLHAYTIDKSAYALSFNTVTARFEKSEVVNCLLEMVVPGT